MKLPSIRIAGPLVLCLTLLLQACSTDPEPSPRPGAEAAAKAMNIKPGYKVGIPYKIKGKRYLPEESFTYVEEGDASWYGEYFHGRLTANGEIYDMNAMTAAHKTLQLPTIVRVTNLQNGNSVIVRVNDRGPFVDDRIIDMSKGAAEVLGFREQGITPVRVEVLTDASKHLQELAQARATVGEMDSMVAALNIDKQDSLPPVQTATAIQPPVRPAATAISGNPGSWFLQAAAFGDASNADRARSQLQHLGPTVVIPRPKGDQTLYLVRVGPYDTKQKAQSALDRVREVGFDDALVVASS